MSIVTTGQHLPDLVPFSPLGTSPTAFCRIEGGGKLLRVTVKNQGDADAGLSKTTVTFGNRPFTLDTLAIPAGGSVDLLFNLPVSCSPNCSFTINVDSSNQVNESNKQNNSANGTCNG
jgi:subtilase family serine protease